MRVKMRVKKNAKYIVGGVYWNTAMDEFLGKIIEVEKTVFSWPDEPRYHGGGWSWWHEWLEKPFEYSNETDP
jgi:hypothetical protein